MAEEKKDTRAPFECTQDCSTCSADCYMELGESGPSFFDRLESISEHFDAIGEDALIDMLNEAVAELEAEDAADSAEEKGADPAGEKGADPAGENADE